MAKRKRKKAASSRRKGKAPARNRTILLLGAGGQPTALVRRNHVARKRKKRSGGRRRRAVAAPARRKRSGGGRKRRHHFGGGGGSGLSLVPSRDELHSIAGAGVYGWLEGKSKADADFFLNKVPKPIAVLGFAGNTAIALRLLAHFTKNKWLGVAAKSTAAIAAYQLGRKGGGFTAGTEHFQVAGYSDDDVAQQLESGGGYDVAGLSPSADLSWNEWG
jgi:hypothetical protein